MLSSLYHMTLQTHTYIIFLRCYISFLSCHHLYDTEVHIIEGPLTFHLNVIAKNHPFSAFFSTTKSRFFVRKDNEKTTT